jgi:hypothetical protein
MQLFAGKLHLMEKPTMKTTVRLSAILLLVLTSSIAFAQIATKEINPSAFKNLSVGAAFEVELIRGNTPKVVLEVDERYMDQVKVENKGETLSIMHVGRMTNPKKLKAIVTYTQLESLSGSGAVRISAREVINANNLNLSMSGASSLKANIETRDLKIEASGASKFDLQGTSQTANVTLSGASKLDGLSLVVADAKMNVAGASKASIHVTNSLDAVASGASQINYKGNPGITQKVSGASKLSYTG